MSRWGRFTARGGERVEAHITSIMTQASDALKSAIEPRELRSVVLIGGYGRGEGGVVSESGVEKPHNNLDFLVIARGGADESSLKARADRALAPLAMEHGIGMDVGVVREDKLLRSSCLVMWYDMRYGHKTLLGDEAFVAGLDRFRVEKIDPADIRNLLVNRGTLLLINELLAERLPDPNEVLTIARAKAVELDRRTIIKHAVKAIIGYGDALLFSLGDYHFSYVEKQRRMRARNDVPAGLKRLYDEAMEFRFAPSYASYAERDLRAMGRTLRDELSEVHRQCESKRLGKPGLSWGEYLTEAYKAELGARSPREVAKKLVSFVREPHRARIEGKRAKLGFRMAGPRGHLSIVFPYVAYELRESALDVVMQVLEARDARHSTLVRAYLRAWSVHGDTNFESVIRRHSLSLEIGAHP